jgi:GNAT superfamily N-acetyltransferase
VCKFDDLIEAGTGDRSRSFQVRDLDPQQDGGLVLDLYHRSADSIELEFGRRPEATLVDEYFADAPPGGDAATSLKLGLFEGVCLIGIADLAYRFPEPGDAYLGRLMLAHEERGTGIGRQFLRYLEEAGRKRGARRLLLSVLDTNIPGRKFWDREGYGNPMSLPPIAAGQRINRWIRLEKPL